MGAGAGGTRPAGGARGGVRCRASGPERSAVLVVAGRGVAADGLGEFVDAAAAALGPSGAAVLGIGPEAAGAGEHDALSLGREVRVAPDQRHPRVLRCSGTSSDAVAVAVDPTAGLLGPAGLAPALCVVVGRGPALGPDVDWDATVSAARRSALLGVPTVAATLATADPAAPAVALREALLRLLPAVGAALRLPAGPANVPRAHFPFPSRGRWASLGAEIPLDGAAAGVAGVRPGEWALEDAWSLGGEIEGAAGAGAAAGAEGRRVLRSAFAQGDVVVSVCVPPGWGGGFAPARPGAIWHREQVEAAGAGGAGPAAGPGGDLFGRSLPSQGLGASGQLGAGRFVPQDQTARVERLSRGGEPAGPGAGAEGWREVLGAEGRAFRLGPGKLLSDPVRFGDVDAVFSGRAAVTALQTWPAGHPLALTDAALAASLGEGEGGVPLWLTER